ncbi:MAG: carbamoyltransferase HypF, partial [Candidatus Bipolaricaulota bacterium]
MNRRQRKRLLVSGTVQGVGFRPFVYRIAHEYGVGGSVRNLGTAGVEILVEGTAERVAEFAEALRDRAPQLARIASVVAEELPPIGQTAFSIVPSAEGGDEGGGALPPDTAICSVCVADVRGETRFHGYWATSCTDCGPRFTVIEGLPYDRPLTSMREFPLCADCEAEYTDPMDRRYHAQTTACPVCGPQLAFDGVRDEALGRAAQALRDGKILAIKGLGGTHLACRARDPHAVETLRGRLGRSGQPFAVMSREEDVEDLAFPDSSEWALLRGAERPIVIIRRREGALPEAVGPGLDTVGIMLPYSGLQILLLDLLGEPIVLTSANAPGRPMWTENREIEEKARGIADHTLLHDRRIVARCDDSVVRRAAGRMVFIRRSRGYTPERLPIDLGPRTILALGAETGVAFALYTSGGVTLSQHIGSVDQLESLAFLRDAVAHLRRLSGVVTVDVVACDRHPRFLTSSLAGEFEGAGARRVPVQHHVAHLASVLGETREERAVGVVLDGYGYGADGGAWGGEILAVRDRRVERVGCLRPVLLPGGDAAARSPLRMAASYLLAAGSSEDEVARGLAERGWSDEASSILFQQIARRLNAPATTSAGRFLDAVAAWWGIARERTYEGEPAMRLEAAARRGHALTLDVPLIEENGLIQLDLPAVFAAMDERRLAAPDAAATAQEVLARGAAALAVQTARARDIDLICLTGGVAANGAIAEGVRRETEVAGLRWRSNSWVPPGDGGVSFGQAVAAAWDWELHTSGALREAGEDSAA